MPKLRLISLLMLCLVLLQPVSTLGAAPLVPAMEQATSAEATSQFMITSVRYNANGSAILVEWNRPTFMTVSRYHILIQCGSSLIDYAQVGPTVQQYSIPVALAGLGCHSVRIMANGPVVVPPMTQLAPFPL